MKMKVFGGITFINHTQYRVIIATTSKKKVVEAFKKKGVNITLYEVQTYWCETSNEKELMIALSKPNTIFCNDKPFVYE